MTVLTTAQRREAWAEMMRFGGITILKADLLAAFNALDDWIDTNASAINAEIPPAARSGLSTQQKAFLLALVLRKRYDVGA